MNTHRLTSAERSGHDAKERAARASKSDEVLLARALIDQIPDFLFVKDLGSRFLMANASLAAAYGFADRDGLLGKTDFDLHPLPTAQAFYAIEQRIMAHGEPVVDMEESFPNSHGELRWYLTTKLPLRDRHSRVMGLIGIGRDITERKQMEQYRHEQGHLLEMIAKNEPLPSVLKRLVLFTESQIDGIRSSILLLDGATGQLRTGAAPSLPPVFCAAVDGVRIGSHVGSCGTAAFRGEPVVVPDIQASPLWRDYRELAAAFDLRACWSTPILSHDGSVLGTFAMYANTVREPNATETLLIDVATRIAGIAIQRQQSEDRITFIAHHDALTHLPNRSLLHERLARAIQRAEAGQAEVALVFIDLDNFKDINDGLGHKAGDLLLRTTAARMVAGVREQDSVFRLGGDEFVILLTEDVGGEAATAERLDRLADAIRRPVDVDGRGIVTSCSMGVAVYPRHGHDPESLLLNADAAMYAAKQRGRNTLQFYDPCMTLEKRERLELQELMRGAIERGEMFLVYQPQIDLKTGRVFAVEALLRWRHPRLGLISPAKFIPIAEESGFIVALGDWVLRAACQQNQAWQDAGEAPIMMSVNVSARQFMQKDWTRRVESALRASGMSPRYLDLEVTESVIMTDVPRAVATMRELRAIGVHLSIDDFGTGYSSLSALKSFPVERLKIDQSFVRDLSFDDNGRAIAAAVISMGLSLGLRVIAEGVETAEQLAFLAHKGCDQVQGYYFSKPLAAQDVRQCLARQMDGAGAAALRQAAS